MDLSVFSNLTPVYQLHVCVVTVDNSIVRVCIRYRTGHALFVCSTTRTQYHAMCSVCNDQYISN